MCVRGVLRQRLRVGLSPHRRQRRACSAVAAVPEIRRRRSTVERGWCVRSRLSVPTLPPVVLPVRQVTVRRSLPPPTLSVYSFCGGGSPHLSNENITSHRRRRRLCLGRRTASGRLGHRRAHRHHRPGVMNDVDGEGKV